MTKPMQSPKSDRPLKRVLGTRDLVVLGLGTMVGSGIFVLTGVAAARYAGPAVIVSFALAGLAALLLGLLYAELASALPLAGGAYSYAQAAFGDRMGWFAGWSLILAYSLAPVAVAVGWSGYLSTVATALGMPIPEFWSQSSWNAPAGGINLPAIGVVLLATAIVTAGIRIGVIVMTVAVGLKLAALGMFVALALPHVEPANWRPFLPFGLPGVARGAAVVFFAYLGFDAVATTAEEARNPQRALPLGILGSLLACMGLYICVTVAFTGIVPQALYPRFAGDPAPLAHALALLHADGPVLLMIAGALGGLISVLVGMLVALPRVVLAMARDGLLPPALTLIHRRLGTPWVTSLVFGLLVAGLAGWSPLARTFELTNLGTLAAFSTVAAAALGLRRSRPGLRRPCRTPFLGVLAPAAIALCGGLMLSIPGQAWAMFGAWHLLGIALRTVLARRDPRRWRG